MVTPNSRAIIAAAADEDLAARALAVAVVLGIPNAEYQTEKVRRALVVAPLDESGSTIATVHEYAVQVREDHIAATPPPPGANPAAITDEHLAAAWRALIASGVVFDTAQGAGS